ncbi:hypothetical protein ACO0SA_004224 [Hanseniaspora valbyensis]
MENKYTTKRVSYDDDDDYNDQTTNDRKRMVDFYTSNSLETPSNTIPENNTYNSNDNINSNINNNSGSYLEVSDDGFWTKPDTKIPTTQQERRGRSRHCLDLNAYILNKDLTPEQATSYQVYYRIEELSKQIQENDYSYCRLAQRERSPSPPPIYDNMGNRTNTRENRYKKKMDDERIKLIELAMRSLPNYNAPENYVKPNFFKEKFYVPVDDYKHINFVGLLLGPRGATLRTLQQESGCRIQIRGKGSFKEGRSQEELPKGSMSISEPLHCLVIADSEMKLKNGLKACESIVMKAITSPSGQNDLKREQLKELAKLNGTFRDTDSVACPICGNLGHNRFNCPKSDKYLEDIKCNNCQEFGHLEQDCFVINRKKRQLDNNYDPQQQEQNNKYQKVDNEKKNVIKVQFIEKKIDIEESNIVENIDEKDSQSPQEKSIIENHPKDSKQSELKDEEEEKLAPPQLDIEEEELTPPQLNVEEEELAPPQLESEDDEELAPPQLDSDDDDLAPPPMNGDESD